MDYSIYFPYGVDKRVLYGQKMKSNIYISFIKKNFKNVQTLNCEFFVLNSKQIKKEINCLTY